MQKNKITDKSNLAMAPFNEELSAEERARIVGKTSELMLNIATHVICHTLVDHQDLLSDERLSVAHAFLQRATSTHLCNHKLTTEGLVFEYKGVPFELHEEFRTMTLTRSVYEFLVMFYFIFDHPKTEEQRDIVWNYWLINSRKNLLDSAARGDRQALNDQKRILSEIEQLRNGIAKTETGSRCWEKLDLWTKPSSPGQGGCLQFIEKDGRCDVRRVSYSQAWRFLYHDREMTLLYNYLSMHCHPVYDGLRQYLQQTDEENEQEVGYPLYFSCCFLAHLCRLFLKLIPDGETIVAREFSSQDQLLFQALSHIR